MPGSFAASPALRARSAKGTGTPTASIVASITGTAASTMTGTAAAIATVRTSDI